MTASTSAPSSEARRDARAYRSFLTFDAHPRAVRDALQQITAWLRVKGYEAPDLSISGLTSLPGQAEIAVTHHRAQRTHSFRVRLTESDRRGDEWVTMISMSAPEGQVGRAPRIGQGAGAGWLSMRVSHSGGMTASRPNIAARLIEVLDLRDGSHPAVAGAPAVGVVGVNDLVEALRDPERSGLLFVAATDSAAVDLFPLFTERVDRWVGGIHGMAQAVVLDPAATLAFNAAVGPRYAVPPWSIRTFRTDVDPAFNDEARRHRILGTRRLTAESDHVITGILTSAARGHATERELPAAAQSVMRALNRVEDKVLLDRLLATTDPQAPGVAAPEPAKTLAPLNPVTSPADTAPLVDSTDPSTQRATAPPTDSPDLLADDQSAPPHDSAPSAGRHLLSTLRRILGIETVTEESIKEAFDASVDRAARAIVAQEMATRAAQDQARQAAAHENADRLRRTLEERQERIDNLEDDLAQARSSADDALIAENDAEQHRRAAEEETRRLRRLLSDQGRFEEAFAVTTADEAVVYPDSFEDLVDRLPELETLGVVFTGDVRVVLALDDQDTLGTIAQQTWESLLVLSEYVRAKESGVFTGNVKTYLTNTPAGYRSLPPKRFGERESTSTMNRWASERVLPVPTDVEKDGYATMEPHFKLPKCGMVSPRLHFLDHTHDSGTGRVYVGYIGPHLTTDDS